MKNFRDEYKNMMDRMQVPDLDAEQILRSERQKKIVQMRRRRKFVAIGSAACLFLLCSAGVAAMAGYSKSIIRTDENGFQMTDMASMQRFSAEGSDTGAGAEGALDAAAPEANVAEGAVTAGTEAETVVEEYKENATKEMEKAHMPLALPPFELLGSETTKEEYLTTGDSYLYARLQNGERLVTMNQFYYGNTEGHASAISFSGGICNERIFTAENGFDWTVVDSIEEEGFKEIHAAISVGDYELVVNFSGYTEEEAFLILDAMDLSIYLK